MRFTVCLLALLVARGSLAAGEKKLDFLRDIRPILSDNCFLCHGPDEKNRKADLRLDTREGAFAEVSDGRVVTPGKAGASAIWQRIASHDPKKQMPPAKTGKKLSEKQKELIKQWIDDGATWTTHWAFTPPARPAIPSVSDPLWARNAIDRFVLAKLDQEKLTPARETDRITFLRRLSLDLIGLPPTATEVDAFVNDKSPGAYDKQVERLLASPHHGERWGRLWLDAARYADSDGYEKDKLRQVWAYRDWVVHALNQNLPYDQFVRDQLAGDLLPNATQEQRIATGFLRNSMINEEGGVDPEQFRMEAMFDRMDALGKSMLGLTIQCAQCHTHKYDPLTHEEYYRLFAFINNDHESCIAVYTPEEERRRANIFQKIQAIEADLKHRMPDWEARMAAWEKNLAKVPQWQVVRPGVDDISTGGQKYLPLADGSFLAQGYAPTKHRVKMTVKVDQSPITAVRLELLTDPNLPLSGPGRSILGTGALTEFDVEAAAADEPKKVTKIKIRHASADFNPPDTPLAAIFGDKSNKKRVTGPIAYAIDGKQETAWCTDAGPGRSNQPREAVFTFEKPLEYKQGTILTIYLQQNHGGWNSDDNQNCNLGRMRLSITSQPDAVADAVPPRIREIVNTPASKRGAAQQAALFSHWRSTVSAWKDANQQIEDLWKSHPAGSSQLVLAEREKARSTHLLMRGDFLKPANPVRPGVPAFLQPLPDDAPANRLTLARWLTDRQAPTTARSFVNRVWQAYFGTGIVSTSEDLGSQSDAPSHPELLDWLAVEFMQSGWDVKHLHRLIVSSATYRQTSQTSDALYAQDPQNRLLARGPRFRVDAEVVRDVALAASGLLDCRLGGPSVFPPAPAFMFQPPTSYGPKIWNEETGSNRFRRALYAFRYRSVPYPPLQNFDAPNGDFACVRRSRSNTPLQALTALNEPLFLECAKALAAKVLKDSDATEVARLVHAFRACVSRAPMDEETRVLTDLLDREKRHYTSAPALAKELVGTASLPKHVGTAQAAAWTAVCRVLLNLDETITKE